MSQRANSPLPRRALRSGTKKKEEAEQVRQNLEKNQQKPYEQLHKYLHDTHERSLSPGHRSYDDETDDEEPINNTSKNLSYASTSARSSPSASPRSPVNTSDNSSIGTPPPKTKVVPVVISQQSPERDSQWSTIVVVVVGLIFVVVAVVVSLSKSTTTTAPSIIKKCDGFYNLRTNYPKYEEDIFISLKFSVEDLLNKDPCRPSVFLFVHDSKFDIRSFIGHIVSVSTKCLKTTDPLLLTSKDFRNAEMTKDYGVALEKYKAPLEQSSILVVYDVDDVPATTAQAFHTICDTFNPLVEKAIILLTLRATQSQMNATDNANTIAETRLRERWMDLAEDKLEPLIARVTDQVFVISSIFN